MSRLPHVRIARSTAVTAAIALLAVTGCAAQSGSSEPTGADGEMTLKLAAIGLTSDGSITLGIEKGFFADEGLNIETSIVANPPAGLAAAQSGQVDLAYAPSIPVLNALSQGIPLDVVIGADGYPDGAAEAGDPGSIDDTGLYASAQSGITSVDELSGKTIAVPARKAQLEVTITNTLVENGADPSTVNWVVLDFASAVAALKNGTIDAAGLTSQFRDQAEADGATVLAAPGIEFFEEGAVGLWVAGESTVQGKSEALAAFQRAIVKSGEYANAHPEEAVQAGLDFTKSTLSVDEVRVPYWTPHVRQADIERVNDKLVDLGFLSAPVPLDGVIMGEG